MFSKNYYEPFQEEYLKILSLPHLIKYGESSRKERGLIIFTM